MLSAISSLGAIFLTGLVVKFMDDLLDEGENAKTYLFKLFGTTSYIYCLVMLLIASALDLQLTFVLFVACYSLGMLNSLSMVLPSTLPSWVEIILAIAFSLVVAGIPLTIWAFLAMTAIQILDDLIDQKYDHKFGFFNLALVLGVERATLLFLLLLYLSLVLQPFLTVLVLSSALFISEYLSRREFNG